MTRHAFPRRCITALPILQICYAAPHAAAKSLSSVVSRMNSYSSPSSSQMSRQITSVITHVTIPQNCAERRGLEPHSFRYAPAFETGCNTCMRDSPCVLRAFRRDRTADLSLFRGALYRLSYKGIWCGTWLRYDHISRLSRCPTCVDSRAACARPATRSSRLRPWTSPTVPAVGVEPTCPFGHRGLSSARMPFRQAGIVTVPHPCSRTYVYRQPLVYPPWDLNPHILSDTGT